MQVDADLRVEIVRENESPVTAHLRGKSNRLVLEVDQPGAFAGPGDAPMLRALASQMAKVGAQIRVEHQGTHLVTLGAVSAPWWHRRLTGSRRIKLGSARGLWTSARSRVAGVDSILPSTSTLPPSTMWPPFPTFQLRSKPAKTTTHDPSEGGAPRLVRIAEATLGAPTPGPIWLGEETVIGSDQVCDLVLDGLEPLHAKVRHSVTDEYVVESLAGSVRVHGEPVEEQILRTGARVQVGRHTLIFVREEYADHGRPFGGRVGGELGRQRPQPDRSRVLDLGGQHDEASV